MSWGSFPLDLHIHHGMQGRGLHLRMWGLMTVSSSGSFVARDVSFHHILPVPGND